MIAVRAADLTSPARHGLGKDGRTALTAAGPGRIRTGEVVVFCKPVAVAAAVVRRDGRVQAGGHLADHVRLGAAEEQLDRLCGEDGVIGKIAAKAALGGKLKGGARRALNTAMTIRLVLLMTLVPGSCYAEAVTVLLGDLPLVPWHKPYKPPSPPAVCAWREAAGPAPLEELRDRVLAGVDGEHRDHDWRVPVLGGLDIGAIDGSLIRVPDSTANREAFGSAGTADGSAPYPQLRELRLAFASTRATAGVVTGPAGAGVSRDKGEAEQALLDQALGKYPHLFTPGRLWIMDRNFPGVPRIKKMLATGTHVLIRLKDGITLTRTGGFLPDGSYLAVIRGGGEQLTVRVIEYTVTIAGNDTPELFCLITDLTGHMTHPAADLARAYHWRWIGSETTLKENKSAIRDSGPSTGPMLRSGSPALAAQEHAAWVTACELARALARDAAAIAVPARKGRRAGLPVHPREISFAAARRALITSARSGAATTSLPRALAAANRARILDVLARCKITIDRGRHRDRKTKARLAFPRGGPVIPALTAPAQISICGTTAA
jgi:hypothetical protein